MLEWLGDKTLAAKDIAAEFAPKMRCGKRTIEMLLKEGRDSRMLVQDAKTKAYRANSMSADQAGGSATPASNTNT